MAINKNHEFEELDGVKCAIVERNVSKERVGFLKDLLEYNGYTVVTIPSPPPKAAPAAVAAAAPDAAPVVVEPAPPPPPETYTMGVTNVMFNPINAIFGRLLKTRDGHTVTLAYWNQEETVAHDEIPYFEKK
jgi:hypothetical protein